MEWWQRLSARLDELGWSKAELHRRSGISYDNINKYLRGDVSQPRGDTMERLAEITDVNLLWLRDGILPKEKATGSKIVQLQPAKKLEGKSKMPSPEFTPAPYTQPGARDLKVLGAARGGTRGMFMSNGEVFDIVARPGNLVGVKDAYAVYMVGDCMEPRYYSGWLLGVNPNKPFRRGHSVVVQIQSGEHDDIEYLVKEFVRQNDKTLILRQFNPEEELAFPINTVRAIHRITGSTEDD